MLLERKAVRLLYTGTSPTSAASGSADTASRGMPTEREEWPDPREMVLHTEADRSKMKPLSWDAALRLYGRAGCHLYMRIFMGNLHEEISR